MSTETETVARPEDHPIAPYLRMDRMPHIWCPTCGIGTIVKCFASALGEAGVDLDKTAIVSGIGCTGRVAGYMNLDAFHATHGRAIPFATGLKLGRPELEVVVFSGDGDLSGIGGNHFIHAARRNIDVTAIVLNNLNYGMTGGQVSGTTPEWSVTSTTAFGNPEREFDICALAGTAGANYVARCSPLHGWEMKEIMKQALAKKGFSLVEVISPCPTHFGRYNEMKETPAMLRWLGERALPVERFRGLAAEQRHGHFPVGTLVDRDEPGFNERYETVRARAQQQ